MNNPDVRQLLLDCSNELNHIATTISSLGPTSSVAPYLTKYALIRACGAIEVSFKALITDHCCYRSKKQVKRFIQKRVRDGSANPSHSNIIKFLSEFDEDWKKDFSDRLNLEPNKSVLTTALQSLVDGRNDFAHGGSPSVTIGDVLLHFVSANRIIEIMDDVIG